MEEDNNNKGTGILIGVLILFILAAAAAFYFYNQANTESTAGETEESTDYASETSELNDSEPVTTTSVSLDESAVSFFVPIDVVEVDSPTVYKQYQSTDNCEYIGQDSDRELLVVAYTSDACIISDEFTASEPKTILGSDVLVSTLQGNKDLLILEQIEMGNGVSLAFFYKEKFESSVSADIESIIESFEIEIAQ